MLGWCSSCARLVLKLCSGGAQIVLGWCSNCAWLVLKLCSAGAQIVPGWCSNCASAGAKIVLFLWSLWCSFCRPFGPFLAQASFFLSLDSYFCGLRVLFLCFFFVFLCFFFVLFGALFVSACACFGGWYLRVNEVLRFRVRMGSGFRI